MSTLMADTGIRDRLLLTGFLVAGIVLSFMFGSMSGWIVLVAILVGAALLGSPRVCLLTYIAWITVGLYFNRLFPDSFMIKWSDEVFAGAMLLILFVHRERHHRYPELKWVTRSLIGLLVLIAISAVANQVPMLLAFHFCLQYMRWFLIFYFAYIFLLADDAALVIKVIVGLFLMQVLLDTGWLLGLNPMPNWAGGADFSIGTGMGANLVGYFSVAFVCLGFAVATNAATRGGRRAGLLGMAVGLYQLYISFTVHAYFLLLLCLAVQAAITGLLWQYRRVVAWGLTAGLVTFLTVHLMRGEYTRELIGNIDMPYIVLRWDRMWSGPKGQTYHDVLTRLPRDIPFPIIGAGPGNAGSNVAMGARRPLADRYFNWVLLSQNLAVLGEGGSVTSGPHTGILTMLSELGPFGVLFFWGIHLYAVLRVTRQIRAGAYHALWQQRVLAEAFVPTMVMLLLLAWIADYWFIAFINNSIWVWAAVVWTPFEPEEEAVPAAPAEPPGPRPAIAP